MSYDVMSHFQHQASLFLCAITKGSPAMSSSARTFGHRVVKLAPGAGLGIILLFFQLFQDQIEFHKTYFKKQRKNKSTNVGKNISLTKSLSVTQLFSEEKTNFDGSAILRFDGSAMEEGRIT